MKKDYGILRCSFIFMILSLCVIVIFELPTMFYYAPLAVFAVWMIYQMISGGKLCVSASCGILAVFSAVYSYTIKGMNQDRFYPLYLYLYIVLFYFAGTNIVNRVEKNSITEKERSFETVYICISVLLVSYVALTYAADFFDGGLSETLEPMFLWTDDSRPSTDYGVMCLPAIVSAAYLLFCRRGRTLSTVILLVIIVCNMLTQRRTVFFVMPIVFFVCFVCIFVFGAWQKKTRISVGLIVLVGAAASAGFVYFRIDTVKAFLFGDKLGRLSFANISDIFNNARFVSVRNLLANFSFEYMGGEHYAAQFGNPHNMWLNIYDNAGIPSFLLFLIFTVVTVYYLIKLCAFAKSVSANIKCLFVTSFAGMVFQSSLEPVLVSDVFFVMLMFFVFGAIKSFADCAEDRYWITKRLLVKFQAMNNQRLHSSKDN